MNKKMFLIALKNVVWLVLGVLPVFFVLLWLQTLIVGMQESRELVSVLQAGVFFYLSIVIPVLIGGVVHQILLVAVSKVWAEITEVWFRIVALLISPLIPVAVWLSWGGEAKHLLPFTIPMILVLIVYVFLMRKPVEMDK